MMKKLFFSVLFSFCGLLCVCAVERSEQDALALARDFFVSKGGSQRAQNADDMVFTLNYKATDIVHGTTSFYAFNRKEGGFVLVSGNDNYPHAIIGYSETGSFEYDNLPECRRWVIDALADGISMYRSSKHVATVTNRPEVIEPLLGQTSWHQNWPFNLLTPTISGEHCPTGCVPTAAAQVMYYHQWPQQGRGSVSYEWNGQTLSADFSQSVYQWGLMTPTYDATSSQESCDAVALLLRDVGYACHTDYAIGGSGAGGAGLALLDYFDYDESMGDLHRDECDGEMWMNSIVNELVNARPVIYSGGSSAGAHALVIDGYDGQGYYHFNFGWGGKSDGYYNTSTIVFNSAPSITYGIKKNEGGSPTVMAYSSENVLYGETTDCVEVKYCLRAIRYRSIQSKVALAMENTSTHEITYLFEQNSSSNWQSFVYPVRTVSIPDGSYILYPVWKLAGDESYKKVIFHEDRQTYVDLTVENGNYTFSNNHIYAGLQDGAVEIDGIYYFLDSEKLEAEVTFCNDNYNSYSGNVVIPGHVTYEGQDYVVTSIGKGAFRDCEDLGTVSIPNTVRFIGSSFYSSILDKVVFEEPAALQEIGGFAFQATTFKSGELYLPEGLKTLRNYVFQGTAVETVSFPNSLAMIGKGVFNYPKNIKNLYVRWGTPPQYGYPLFEGVDLSACTLYVPGGKAELYRAVEPWSDFGNIIEDETMAVEQLNSATAATIALPIYSLDGVLRGTNINALPKGVYIQGKKKLVK